MLGKVEVVEGELRSINEYSSGYICVTLSRFKKLFYKSPFLHFLACLFCILSLKYKPSE